MRTLYLLFFIFSTFMYACSWPDKSFDFKTLYSSDLDNNSHILYSDILPFVYSKQYYRIRASLYTESSFFVLNSHTKKDLNTNTGIKVHTKRKGPVLEVFVSTPKFSKKLLFKDDMYFETTNEIYFTFEVSNEWNDIYVKLWSNFFNKTGLLKQEYYSLKKDYNLLADSNKKDIIFYSHGEGLHWGLQLHKTKLNYGKRISLK